MALEPEILFINSDYIKRYTNLNNSVQDDVMKPAIILAQDKHIQIYLGSRLYERILTDIGNGTLAGNYLSLVENYILKAAMWWTMVELLPNMQNQVDNGGVVNNINEDSQPASSSGYYSIRNQARDNAEFYTERLVEYISDNNNLFPEYNENSGSDISPQKDAYSENGVQYGRNRRNFNLNKTNIYNGK